MRPTIEHQRAPVDLSQPLTDASPKSPLLPTVSIWSDVLEIPVLPPECHIQTTQFSGPVHVGTHVDAPRHFFPAGNTVDAYEPGRFVSEAVIVALPHRAGDAVSARDLKQALPEVRPGDSVLLCFGYGGRCLDESYFDYPWLTEDAAQHLVSLGIGMVGTDTLSPDAPPPHRAPGFDYPAHRVLLGNDVLVVENLGTGLEDVAGERVLLVAPPLPIPHADGGMLVPYAFRLA